MSVVHDLKIEQDNFKLEIKRWEIADQGITALWGPSGCGKTTVIKALLGLESVATLKWMWGEQDYARIPVGGRRFGVVFQNCEIFPHMSIERNVAFAAQARGISDWKSSFKNWSTALGLESITERKARHLSGGERQRAAILCALIGRPRFLFLDEPFSNLDDKAKAQAQQLIREVTTQLRIPTLLITHNPTDVEGFANGKVDLADLVS